MTFGVAGGRVRAAVLREACALTARSVLSPGVYNGTTFSSDIPGLAVQLDTNSFYQIDGYLAYRSEATPAIKFIFTVPPDAAGHWTLMSITSGGVSGNVEGLRRTIAIGTSLAEAGAGGAASSSPMACIPRGYVRTANFPGVLQWQFAQATGDTLNPALAEVGSWLRVTKMGDR